MRLITYNDDDLTLMRSMKRRSLSRVFHDGAYQLVFDFSTDRVLAFPISLDAATQNKSDEAITVHFESKSGAYSPSKHDICLFANSVIDRIWIARTVLYFTDCTPFKSEEDAIRGIEDSTPIGRILRETMRTSTVRVVRTRHLWNKTSQEVMFYISSLPPNAQKLGQAIRQHWSIENQLHWVLDVTFGEDACRIRTGNAPENIALLKRWSINLLNQETSFKRSTRQKSRRASMDEGYLLKVLASSIPLQSNLSDS